MDSRLFTGTSLEVSGASRTRYLRARSPVNMQQTIVPSLTPPRFPRPSSPMTAAMMTIDVSEQTRTFPYDFLTRSVRAYTNPSPGTMTTFATTWRYTPNASMNMPMTTDAIWSQYSEGA